MILCCPYVLKDSIMENYNHIQFMTPDCHNQYYDEFLRTKLLEKRGIFLEKVTTKLLTFHTRL